MTSVQNFVLQVARDRIMPAMACMYSPKAKGVCSGVFVDGGDAQYLVTAAHNLDDVRSAEDLAQIRVGSFRNPSGVALTGVRRKHSASDVALLRLPRDAARSLRPISIERGRVLREPVPVGSDAIVVGFPSQLVHEQVKDLWDIRRFGLFAYIGPVDEIDDQGRLRIPFGDGDLISMPSERPIGIVNPEGMSGGGVFCLVREHGDLLSIPLDLCGIQSAIGTTDRQLRAEPSSSIYALMAESVEAGS